MTSANEQIPLAFDGFVLHERISARAQRIRVEVRAGGEVLLVIPRGASRREALGFLAQHHDWLRRKLSEQRTRGAPRPRPLAWDGQDTLPLRGVPHHIVVVPVRLRRAHARLEADCIRLLVPAARRDDHGYLRQSLVRELRETARHDARRLLNEESLRLGLPYGGLRIADQRTLWGSCAADGLISLNWRLVMAPPPVLRYVVVHELCHLRWRSHGPRFWGLVARQMPDYDSQRRWLREHGASLHAALPEPGAGTLPQPPADAG
jgi:predicted metal-dependent hydrolase